MGVLNNASGVLTDAFPPPLCLSPGQCSAATPPLWLLVETKNLLAKPPPSIIQQPQITYYQDFYQTVQHLPWLPWIVDFPKYLGRPLERPSHFYHLFLYFDEDFVKPFLVC